MHVSCAGPLNNGREMIHKYAATRGWRITQLHTSLHWDSEVKALSFLQDPAILLCDEATSALDSRTEKQILQALQHLASGRTSLFVAHRLSTAAQCDQIVVLEGVSRMMHTAAHPSAFNHVQPMTALHEQ